MKMFYTIGEVADLLDLPTSTVRFWESQFDVLRPSKNQRGHRKFTTQDVENLKTIYHLVREKGMTLEGAKRRLRSGSEEVRHDGEIMERLLGIRALLVEIRNELGEDGAPVFEETVIPAPSLSSRTFGGERVETARGLCRETTKVGERFFASQRSERSESRDLIPVAAVSEGAAEAAPILVAEDTNCHRERSTQCAVEGYHSEDETLRQAQGDDSPPPVTPAPELPTVVEQTLF